MEIVRELNALDFVPVCNILTKIGVKEFKSAIDVEALANPDNTAAVGVNIVFGAAGVIIENMPKAYNDIITFMASLTGAKSEDIEALPFDEFTELLFEIIGKAEFKNFFKRAFSLFNQ